MNTVPDTGDTVVNKTGPGTGGRSWSPGDMRKKLESLWIVPQGDLKLKDE